MKKKIIKILILLFTIMLVIIAGDYIYLKIQISKERIRIDNEKNINFIIDNNKIEVIQDPHWVDSWSRTQYNIDFEKSIVETRISYGNYMPLETNKLLIWDEQRLELKDLKMTKYNELINTKVLSSEEKYKLEKLINKICNMEENISDEVDNEKDETKKNLIEIINLSSEFKINTKDKKNILMNNEEDKKIFLKLVE